MCIASNNNIYVTWVTREGLFFRKSIDNGTTFEKKLKLENFNEYNYSVGSKIQVDENDNIFIVCPIESPDDYRILLLKSDDNGESFSKKKIFPYNENHPTPMVATSTLIVNNNAMLESLNPNWLAAYMLKRARKMD